MTDKEQIMINGVDVHRCPNLNKKDKITCCEYYRTKCYEVDDCIFKQLARKTQECKELRIAYNKAQDILGRVNNANEIKSYSLQESIKECEKLTNKNNLLTAELNQIKLLLEGKNTQYNVKVEECEELKKENQELRNSLSDSLMFRFTSQDKEVDRYRKALEEIDKVINNIFDRCLGRNTVGCRPAHNVCGELIRVLDIINKAKGERNND